MDDQNQINSNLNDQQNANSSGKFSADDFVEKDILELMGAKDMAPKEKEELYKKMIETIETRVIARIDDQLSDEEAAELKKIVDSGDQSKFKEFLKEKDIDIEKIYAEETLIYKIEMVELMNDESEE